jgi:acetylornithine deacetylase
MSRTRLDTEALLARLVAFDTTSRNSNLALIDFVADYLDGFGLRCEVLRSPDGAKANLLASIGPGREGGVVLSGHTDVVPVDGQHWHSDPFRLLADDERLTGRGTSDMKGFIACVLAAVPDMPAARLASPLHLAFSYDEEVGCLGAPQMIRHMLEQRFAPRAVLIGEPTDMRVMNAHKGMQTRWVEVCGHEAHSSQTQLGVSAVGLAGRLIHWLMEAAEARRREGRRDPRFTPAWSTLSVNQVQGGTAVNILAGRCEFTWELRHLPGDDPAALLEDFRRFCARLEAEAREISPRVSVREGSIAEIPALVPEARGAAEALARLLTAAEDDSGAVAFCTEGGQFQQAGFSTVVCGPGSVAQAHQPDEHVSRADLARCQTMLAALLQQELTAAPRQGS